MAKILASVLAFLSGNPAHDDVTCMVTIFGAAK